MFPKPVRHRDEDYLRFVRSRPCAVCLQYGAVPHHLQTRGAGGSDHVTVPLCLEHHSEIHTLGLIAFEDKYDLSLWRVVSECLSEYLRRDDDPR